MKESLMGAGINIARAYTRLMTLARQLSASPPPLPSSESLPSATDYFRLAKRKLESSYKAAVTFALHQYQFLAYWNMAELHLADDNSTEALHYYGLLLSDVFRKCGEDAVSRVLEWPVEHWQAEELSTQLTAGALVRRMVEEGEVVGGEAVELVKVGFGWLNAARRAVKGGGRSASGDSGVVVDVEQKNVVAVLFNWMKSELGRREVRGPAVAAHCGSESGVGRNGIRLSGSVSRHSDKQDTKQQQPVKRRKLTTQSE